MRHAPGGQSSPATLQLGQQVSNGMRQIPHTSSFISHFHTPTAYTRLTVTFCSLGHRARGKSAHSLKQAKDK